MHENGSETLRDARLKVMWQNELQPDDCVQSIFFPAPLTT
jgi:hypothetical protein